MSSSSSSSSSVSTAQSVSGDNLAWVKPLFKAAFDESHAAAGGKSATGQSPAVAAVHVLTQVIKTSRGAWQRCAECRSIVA
jgi:hypothetical protein